MNVNYNISQEVKQTNYTVEIDQCVINYVVTEGQATTDDCYETMEFNTDLETLYQISKL